MNREKDPLKHPISRRTLMAATGAALAGGIVAINPASQALPQEKKGAAKATPTDTSRSWICSDGFRNTELDGQKGFQIRARFTGYRGLPLNVIMGAELKIDGQRVDPNGMILTLAGNRYKLMELSKLGGSKDFRAVPWLYVLDKAEIFCPWPNALSAGEHEIEGYLLTRGIYGTGGRGEMSTPKPTTKRLVLETDL